jgi:hypothetical protein
MKPLGMLRELSNVDKHRYLPQMLVRAGSGSYARDSPTRWTIANCLDDGANLFQADDEMGVKGHLVLEVTIPPSVPVGRHPPAFPKGGEPLYSTLMVLYREVVAIVDVLTPFIT